MASTMATSVIPHGGTPAATFTSSRVLAAAATTSNLVLTLPTGSTLSNRPPPPLSPTTVGLGIVVPLCAVLVTLGAIWLRLYKNKLERQAAIEAKLVELPADDIPIELEVEKGTLERYPER